MIKLLPGEYWSGKYKSWNLRHQNLGELWPWQHHTLRVQGGHSKTLQQRSGEGLKFTFLYLQSNLCICNEGTSELTIVLGWSRAMLIRPMQETSCSVTLRQPSRFFGLYRKIKGQTVQNCCKTFSTRVPLWCVLKINNAGLVLARCVLIPDVRVRSAETSEDAPEPEGLMWAAQPWDEQVLTSSERRSGQAGNCHELIEETSINPALHPGW